MLDSLATLDWYAPERGAARNERRGSKHASYSKLGSLIVAAVGVHRWFLMFRARGCIVPASPKATSSLRVSSTEYKTQTCLVQLGGAGRHSIRKPHVMGKYIIIGVIRKKKLQGRAPRIDFFVLPVRSAWRRSRWASSSFRYLYSVLVFAFVSWLVDLRFQVCFCVAI